MSNIKNEIELDLNEIFNDDWLNNVYNAAILAMCYGKDKDKDVEEIAKSVIDYNIEKQLEECVLTTLINTLPKRLNWKNKNLAEAFNDFKEILDICSISKFKKYKLHLTIDPSPAFKKTLFLWQDLAKQDYPELQLTIHELKTKNTYRIEIVNLQ